MNRNNRGRTPSSKKMYSSTGSGGRKKRYTPDEIDRYNYVDREIYSHSSNSGKRSPSSYSSRSRKKPPKRKRGCLGKITVALFSVLILAALTGIAYSVLMFSRLNRSSDVTSSQMAGYIQQPTEAPSWNVKSDDSVMNILLIGADRNEDGTDGRSDTNILLSIDSKSKTLRLVSFLRDSYLEIPTIGKNKLNAAYSKAGAVLTMQTLENNYRINIDKYVSVDFKNFAKLIDKMGGLDVKMSKATCEAENEVMGSHLKPGVNHLNGRLCLYYARIRAATDEFGHDDYGRAARQRQVIQLIIQKMKSMNPIEFSKVMYDYLPCVETNLSDSELAYLASIGVTASRYKIKTQQMPANNTFTEPFIDGIGDVVELNLEKNCSLLRKFLYGTNSESSEADQ